MSERLDTIHVKFEPGTYGFLGILEESLRRIGDTSVLLGLSTSTVDTRGGLGRVTTHETKEKMSTRAIR